MWPYIAAGAGLAWLLTRDGEEPRTVDVQQERGEETSTDQPEPDAGESVDEGDPSSDHTASDRPQTPAEPGSAPEANPEREAVEAGRSARERWEREIERLGLESGAGSESATTEERATASEADLPDQE